MPPRFIFYPPQTEAWVLLGPGSNLARRGLPVGIFARLKPGVTLAQAQSELRSLYRAIHTDRETRDFEPVVYDLHGEFTFLASRTLRTTLILVFAAVLLVLLIACLNAANLLLARLAQRRRELAVRAALGSGQGRLVRQVLAEGLLLAASGAALGVAIAWAAIVYFRSANPIELTVRAEAGMNLPVLAFSMALTIATTLVFALLPALGASRVNPIESLPRRIPRFRLAMPDRSAPASAKPSPTRGSALWCSRGSPWGRCCSPPSGCTVSSHISSPSAFPSLGCAER